MRARRYSTNQIISLLLKGPLVGIKWIKVNGLKTIVSTKDNVVRDETTSIRKPCYDFLLSNINIDINKFSLLTDSAINIIQNDPSKELANISKISFKDEDILSLVKVCRPKEVNNVDNFKFFLERLDDKSRNNLVRILGTVYDPNACRDDYMLIMCANNKSRKIISNLLIRALGEENVARVDIETYHKSPEYRARCVNRRIVYIDGTQKVLRSPHFFSLGHDVLPMGKVLKEIRDIPLACLRVVFIEYAAIASEHLPPSCPIVISQYFPEDESLLENASEILNWCSTQTVPEEERPAQGTPEAIAVQRYLEHNYEFGGISRVSQPSLINDITANLGYMFQNKGLLKNAMIEALVNLKCTPMYNYNQCFWNHIKSKKRNKAVVNKKNKPSIVKPLADLPKNVIKIG